VTGRGRGALRVSVGGGGPHASTAALLLQRHTLSLPVGPNQSTSRPHFSATVQRCGTAVQRKHRLYLCVCVSVCVCVSGCLCVLGYISETPGCFGDCLSET